MMEKCWKGFKEGRWQEKISVRDFILKNYTAYDGDESFLESPTDKTKKVWGTCETLLKDLPEALNKIAPAGAIYHHDETWHDGNGNAHVLASIIGSSVTIPVVDGILYLGHWQQIVLIDFDNKNRSRTICVQICM